MLEQITGQRPTGPDGTEPKYLSDENADAYRVFHNYLDVERRMILGLPPSKSEQEDAKHQVAEFYEKWFPLGRF